jgi:hypothetical protein
MAGSERSGQVDPSGSGARLFRLRALRVLLLSADERFRAVGSMLIARRGCVIFTAPTADGLSELITRERIDVVVVEGDLEWAELSVASASLAGFSPPAGLVAVGEQAGRSPSGHPHLAKWGSFDALFAAIEQAELDRGCSEAPDSSGWPPAAHRRSAGT